MSGAETSVPVTKIPIPVPSLPMPFWKRWGVVEWAAAMAIIAPTVAGFVRLLSDLDTIIVDRAITDERIARGEATLDNMNKSLEKVLWYEDAIFKMEFERYGTSSPSTTALPSTRPIVAATIQRSDENP